MFDEQPAQNNPTVMPAPIMAGPGPVTPGHWGRAILLAVVIALVVGGGIFVWYELQIRQIQNEAIDQQAALQQQLSEIQAKLK